jgi:hypothetical protein
MKFIFMQSFLAFCQYFVLRHPQSYVIPVMRDQVSFPHRTSNMVFLYVLNFTLIDSSLEGRTFRTRWLYTFPGCDLFNFFTSAMNGSLIQFFLSHIPVLIDWKEREMIRHLRTKQ